MRWANAWRIVATMQNVLREGRSVDLDPSSDVRTNFLSSKARPDSSVSMLIETCCPHPATGSQNRVDWPILVYFAPKTLVKRLGFIRVKAARGTVFADRNLKFYVAV